MHVTYVLIGISFLLKRCSNRKAKYFCIIFLLFFAQFVGSTPSILRAAIMSILAIISKLFFRKSDILNNISISCLIIIILNPYNIFNLGFQLSFLGTLGIVLFNENIMKVFNKNYGFIVDRICSKSFIKKINCIKYKLNRVKKNINILNSTIEDEVNISEDINIKSIKLSHDVKDIRGFIIEEDNSSMVYITDTGYINEKYLSDISNKNLYIFESNHDVEMLMNNTNYPHYTKIRILSDKGHLSNKDSSYYLSKLIGDLTQYVVLAHISEQNNDEQIALKTLKSTLDRKGIEFKNIIIARQNEMTELFNI